MPARYVAGEILGLVERKLREQQAHDVEVSQARVDVGRARVLLADLEKAERIAERRLGIAVHQCRLLVPQELGPVPIEPETAFGFNLAEPDLIDLGVVPDFPRCHEDAVQLAKRQRLEVRLMIVGLRIARLQQTRDKTRLLGLGQLPLGMSFKNTTKNNGGIALGMIFGSLYDLPVVNLSLWANIGQARLDIIRSQLISRSRCSRSLRMPVAPGTAGNRQSASGAEGGSTSPDRVPRSPGRGCSRRNRRSGSTCSPPRSTCSRAMQSLDRMVQPPARSARHPPCDRALARLYEKAGIATRPSSVEGSPKPDHRHGLLQRMVHLG